MNNAGLTQNINFKWVVESSTVEGCFLKTSIKEMDVEFVLDTVCKPENWGYDYKIIGDTKICTISINFNNSWVSKSGDSFLNAAIKWGIGRKESDFRKTIPSIITSELNLDMKYVPAHDITKYGPLSKIPEGIMKGESLEIKDVNRYVNEFLSTKESK